jgi:hypothetical protein
VKVVSDASPLIALARIDRLIALNFRRSQLNRNPYVNDFETLKQ